MSTSKPSSRIIASTATKRIILSLLYYLFTFIYTTGTDSVISVNHADYPQDDLNYGFFNFFWLFKFGSASTLQSAQLNKYLIFILVMLVSELAIDALKTAIYYLMPFRNQLQNLTNATKIFNVQANSAFVITGYLRRLLASAVSKILQYSLIYCLFYIFFSFMLFIMDNPQTILGDYKTSWKADSEGIYLRDKLNLLTSNNDEIASQQGSYNDQVSSYLTPTVRSHIEGGERALESAHNSPDVLQKGTIVFHQNLQYSSDTIIGKSITLTLDSDIVLIASDKSFALLNLSDLSPRALINPYQDNIPFEVESIFIAPDNETIAFNFKNRTDILDLNTGKIFNTLELKNGFEIYQPFVIFSPDSRTVFMIAHDQVERQTAFYKFDLYSDQSQVLLNFIPFTSLGTIAALRTSHDGKTLFYAQEKAIFSMDISQGTLTTFKQYYQSADRINSYIFSGDGETLFLLKGNPLALEILDMSETVGPVSLSTTQLDLVDRTIFDVVLSPEEDILVVTMDTEVLIIDASSFTTVFAFISNKRSHIDQIVFREDDRTVVSFNRVLRIFQMSPLLVSMDLGEQFNFMDLTVSESPTFGFAYGVALSPSEDEVYVVCEDGLQILTRGNNNVLANKKLIPFNELNSVAISSDGKTAFAASGNALTILNIETEAILSTVDVNSLYEFEPRLLEILNVTLSTDTKLTLLTNDTALNAILIDITNLKSPVSSIIAPFEGFYNRSTWDSVFTKDGDIYGVSISFQEIAIFNLSTPGKISIITRIIMEDKIYTVKGSRDGDSLYMVANEVQSAYGGYFHIFDITDLKNIQELGYLNLDILDEYEIMQIVTDIDDSLDSNTVFLSISNNFYVINTTNKMHPSFINFVLEEKRASSPLTAIRASLMQLPGFALTVDGSNSVRIIDVDTQYTIYMPTRTFYIGDQKSEELILVKRNMIGRFNLLQVPYKFLRVSLCTLDNQDSAKREYSYTVLPGWMNFDRENRILNTAPGYSSKPGNYLIYSSASTILSKDSFVDVASDPSNLLFTLVNLGYIDNDGYLTPSFDPDQPLNFLPPPYNASKEENIRGAMARHYFSTILQISVLTSLNYTLDKKIQIQTKDEIYISVRIVLTGDEPHLEPRCRFVKELDSLITPMFSSQSKTVDLQGSLFDVNNALKALKVDLDDDVYSCNGDLTVRDNLNPTIESRQINHITEMFAKNDKPQVNDTGLSLQQEIEKVKIYTGSYFTIPLDQNRFLKQKLTFSLKNPEQISWLSLQGQFLSGTPPEQLWPLSFDVEMIVKNEYKNTTLPFTLKVRLGITYLSKLGVKVLGALGFWIYFYTILNLLCKSFYKYPKDIELQVDTAITTEQILPVACVDEEEKESRILLNELQNRISKGRQLKAIRLATLLKHFIDPATNRINRTLLFEELQTVLANAPRHKLNKLKLYTQATDKTKQLINQLIVNKLLMIWIDTKEEKLTKKAFQALKEDWVILIQSKRGFNWQLVVDETNVREILIEKGFASSQIMMDENDGSESDVSRVLEPHSISDRPDITTTDENVGNSSSSLNLEAQLISVNENKQSSPTISSDSSKTRSRINFHLLTEAILAYAYNQQTLDYNSINLTISSREKVDELWWCPMFIARPLRLDLRPISFGSGGNLGYGVNYHVRQGVICFSGIVEENFEGKTMTIQISKRGRIIREIWLYGIRGGVEEMSLLVKEQL